VSKRVAYSPSLSLLPDALPCQRDVTPMTSAMTSSARCSSVGRSTSLPNVAVSDDHRHKPSNASTDPPVRFYSGSLRHKDSILLRKSKLRQLQVRPSVETPSAENLKLKNVAVHVVDNTHSDCSNFNNRSETQSPRPRLNPNRDVIASWTAGTWLPELRERSGREPTSSELLSGRRWNGNDEATFHRNSSNNVTVILSAVDLPYASRLPFRCEYQATLDIRCPPSTGSRRHGAATTQYLVEPQRRLRKHPGRSSSANSDLVEEKFHRDAELSSSSPRPEPFSRHRSSSDDDDSGPISRQLSGAPVMTSQRRVHALARAYSDRLKQLQRRSTTTHHADDFNITGDLRVPVQRARARSASVGRRTALPLSPALLYK